MINPVKEFGEVAKGLAYNPLGIIALFIVLCYAIACLFFGSSASTLQASERLPLIWFVVGFPVVVLGTFAWLVVNHHTKLYAPKDFQDSSTWLATLDFRTLEAKEQKVKIESEAAEVVAAEKNVAAIEDKTSETVVQKQTGLARKANEQVRNDVLISEDLCLREIQAEFGVPIQRQVQFGPDSRFDGIFAKGGEMFAVDVKWITTKARAAQWIPISLDKIIRLRVRQNWKRAHFILAAVVQNPDLKTTAEMSYSEIPEELKDLLISRVYIYDELRKKYGLVT